MSENQPKNKLTPQQIELERAGESLLNKQVNEQVKKAHERIEHFDETLGFGIEQSDLTHRILDPVEEFKEKNYVNNLNNIDNQDIN